MPKMKAKSEPSVLVNPRLRASLTKSPKGYDVLRLELALAPNGTFPSGRTRLHASGGQKGMVVEVGGRAFWVGSLLVGDLGESRGAEQPADSAF